MSHTRARAWLLPAVIALALPLQAQNGDFAPVHTPIGDFAPGESLQLHLVATDAEVAVAFAMDPSYVAGRLPAGVRPYTLGDLAIRGDSLIHALLRLRPDLASWVMTTFSVAKVDSAAVGVDGSGGRQSIIAYWWVNVEVVDPALFRDDGRAREGETVVELGFWSDDGNLARQLGGVMPNVSKASVRMKRDGPATWQAELRGSDSRITASCQLVGEQRPIGYKAPAYITVWAGDSAAGPMAVYAYRGHQIQPCRLHVDAEGKGALARALKSAVMFGGTNLSGWSARAMAYPRRNSTAGFH